MSDWLPRQYRICIQCDHHAVLHITRDDSGAPVLIPCVRGGCGCTKLELYAEGGGIEQLWADKPWIKNTRNPKPEIVGP